MSELSLMITITEQDRSSHFRRLYEEMGAKVSFTSFGQGTATSRILNSFGLEEKEKAIIHTIISDDTFPQLRKKLKRRFLIDVPGAGIVFLIPLSSIGGKRQLNFLLGEQPFTKGEESTLKNTEYELIIVIANQGYTELIMDAARSANAGGGTVIHAKGTGMQNSEKFFGFVIAEEKEMIYIVASRSDKNAVMRAIMEQAGTNSKAQSVCFSLPVTEAAGIYFPEAEE